MKKWLLIQKKRTMKMKKRTKESKKVNLEKILLETKISNIMHNHIINCNIYYMYLMYKRG